MFLWRTVELPLIALLSSLNLVWLQVSQCVLQSYFYPFSPPTFYITNINSDKYVFQFLYLLLQLQHVSPSPSTVHADACTPLQLNELLFPLFILIPIFIKTTKAPSSLMCALAKTMLIINAHLPCFLVLFFETHPSPLPSLLYWILGLNLLFTLRA